MSQSSEITILNRILNFVLARGWTDYDNFSSRLAKRLIRDKPQSRNEVIRVVSEFDSSFFSLNGVTPNRFVEVFPIDEIVEALSNSEANPLTFIDVFPETQSVDIATGKRLTSALDIDEDVIQNAIRDSIREKNATNAIERGKDSPLEVADHEHFALKVKGKYSSFAGVVKGYKSVGKAEKVNWEKVAHQVVRAYHRTYPDHILLVLAKNPADSLVSECTEYGKSVNKPNLVILCDPVNLARFLKARGVISDTT